MKYIIFILIIAVVNNLDNIGVRIAYSIRGIKISTLINLWISVITFIISTSAAYSGTLVSEFLSKRLASAVSMLLLSAIGLWIIVEPFIKKHQGTLEISDEAGDKSFWHILHHPHHADRDGSKHIDFQEATVLGIALSINNIGGGMGAGMIGLNSFLVGLFSAIFSFLALWAGNYIAEYFMRWKLGNAATIVAGIALIAIGIGQIM
jgi:putative sporulation protein YtaF